MTNWDYSILMRCQNKPCFQLLRELIITIFPKLQKKFPLQDVCRHDIIIHRFIYSPSIPLTINCITYFNSKCLYLPRRWDGSIQWSTRFKIKWHDMREIKTHLKIDRLNSCKCRVENWPTATYQKLVIQKSVIITTRQDFRAPNFQHKSSFWGLSRQAPLQRLLLISSCVREINHHEAAQIEEALGDRIIRLPRKTPLTPIGRHISM